MNNEQLAGIIRAELRCLGTTAYRFAIESGLPDNALRYVLEGRQPRLDRLAEICDALDLEFYIGPHRASTEVKNLNQSQFNSENSAIVMPPEIVAALNLPEDAPLEDVLAAIEALLTTQLNDDARWTALEAEIVAMRADIRGLTESDQIADPSADTDNSNIADDDSIAEPPALYAVPMEYDDLTDDEALSAKEMPSTRQVATLEIEAAAGGGAYNLDEVPVKGQVWFQRNWLDSRGLDATQCNVISVKGESMEPTLPNGSKILVARHRCRRRAGRIFVLNTEDGLIVKRLGKNAEGHWQLLSDHSSWEAMAWQRDMTVVGEVMWVARSL